MQNDLLIKSNLEILANKVDQISNRLESIIDKNTNESFISLSM